jgi:hypothetical protein
LTTFFDDDAFFTTESAIALQPVLNKKRLVRFKHTAILQGKLLDVIYRTTCCAPSAFELVSVCYIGEAVSQKLNTPFALVDVGSRAGFYSVCGTVSLMNQSTKAFIKDWVQSFVKKQE